MAQGDRLSKWRQGGGAAGGEPPDEDQGFVGDDGPEELGEPRKYVAFRTKDRIPSLQIRRLLGARHAPYYPFLLNVSCDGDFGTNFVLFYTFMQVDVEGRNLQPIIKAIHEKRCVFIQDFHPEEYDEPEKGTSVITSIQIVTKNHADAMAEVEAGKRITETRTTGNP
jgi:hypothetical protein